MGNTIKFGVHRNPQKDANGKETYHVRHETDFALNQEYIISQVKTYNAAEASHINPVIGVLREQIVEILTDNHNVHIEGLGNFYLRLGFRERTDENGQTVKPHFTDPSKITGNDVVVESIGFTPDEEFLKQLHKREYHFVNATGRGKVGHSADVTKEQVIARLDQFFETNDRLLSRDMKALFGLTTYMANKWLEELCTQAPPYLRVEKVSHVSIYYRK
jgi:nucleoid DNA-binding protein